MMQKIIGLLGTIISALGFFMSWGVSSGKIQNPLMRGGYVKYHSGSSAGPYGYITLVIALIASLVWVISLYREEFKTPVFLQLWISITGAIFVIYALASHPKIGWPLGPDVSIIGFILSAIFAGIVLSKMKETGQ